MLRTRWAIAVVIGLTLAAAPTPSAPPVMQAQQWEVVNAAGAVVFSVRATEAGGRLEVWDSAGATIFSAGLNPTDPKQVGLWEQSRQDIANQRRDLHQLTRRVQTLERRDQQSSRAIPSSYALDQQRSELARQEREIDRLERQINQLSRQLQALTRR